MQTLSTKMINRCVKLSLNKFIKKFNIKNREHGKYLDFLNLNFTLEKSFCHLDCSRLILFYITQTLLLFNLHIIRQTVQIT